MSDITVPLLINGKEVKTSTTFPVISPSTGETLWSCASASKQDALDAVSAAEAALPVWSKTKPSHRRDLILRAAEIFAKRTSESHDYMMKETGAVEAFSAFNTSTSIEMFRDVAGRVGSALQGEIPVCQAEGTSALIVKEPYGVILSISPWYIPSLAPQQSICHWLIQPQGMLPISLVYDQSFTRLRLAIQ